MTAYAHAAAGVPCVAGSCPLLCEHAYTLHAVHDIRQLTMCALACRFLSSFLLVGVLALYQMASAVLVGQHELSSDGKAAMVAGAAAATQQQQQRAVQHRRTCCATSCFSMAVHQQVSRW